MPPLSQAQQSSASEELTPFRLTPILPDNLSTRLAVIFNARTIGSEMPSIVSRQCWLTATKQLLSKGEILEAGEGANPSCHAVLKIGHIYLGDLYPDALSTPGIQLSPVACARLIKQMPDAKHEENELLFEIARLLKKRYGDSLYNNTMGHFIYPIIEKILYELQLNPSLPETWDQLSDASFLKTLSCLLCFDIFTTCLVLPNHQLGFCFPHATLKLDFTHTEYPNELMSYGSPEEEFLVILEPFQLAAYFSSLSKEEQAMYREQIRQDRVASSPIKEMLLHVCDLILKRYLTPYLLTYRPGDISSALTIKSKEQQILMSKKEFIHRLSSDFIIDRQHRGAVGDCFLQACLQQLPEEFISTLGPTNARCIKTLREQIARYCHQHFDELAAFIPQRCQETFIAEITEHGWTGEDIVIHVTSILLKRPIYLFNAFGDYHYLDPQGHLKADKIYNAAAAGKPLYMLGDTHFSPLFPRGNPWPALLKGLDLDDLK